jgi:hypothetical protein
MLKTILIETDWLNAIVDMTVSDAIDYLQTLDTDDTLNYNASDRCNSTLSRQVVMTKDEEIEESTRRLNDDLLSLDALFIKAKNRNDNREIETIRSAIDKINERIAFRIDKINKRF